MNLKPFSIGKYPVTNDEYFHFVQDTGYSPEDTDEPSNEFFLCHWDRGRQFPSDIRRHPVTFVSFDDALNYAHFIGGRLPAYEEWIYAAFGNTDSKYPWGNTFSKDFCNVRESGKRGTTPAGLYSPDGDSPTGCCDMAGNVWEWTTTCLDDEKLMFLAMGTGWDHYSGQVEVPLDREYRNHSVGFRVVRDMV